MRKLDPSISVGVVLFTVAACEASDPTAVETPDAEVTTPSSDDEGRDGGFSGDGSSSDGRAKEVSCTSIAEGISAVPTPGKCVGGVAETCDPETSTMRSDPCGADAACKEVVLDERKFDRATGAGWLPSRKIPWAVCVPKSAATCPMKWRNGWLSAETPIHSCIGDAAVACRLPGVSGEWLQTKDGWTVAVGRETGRKISTPCAAGETCRVATSEDAVGCFAKNAPTCQASMPPRCDAGRIVTCAEAFGYERTTSCGAGQSCQSGCAGAAACAPDGAAVCDPGTPITACSTPTSRAVCSPYSCRAEVEDCSTIPVFVGGNPVGVPGRCAVVAGAPRCIRTTDVLCDPATFDERCDGNTAVRCVEGLERRSICTGAASLCGIANGHAGCRSPQAVTCTPSVQPRCEGSSVIDCCPDTGTNPIMQSEFRVCVPRYEVKHDCSSTMMACKTWGVRGDCAAP